jgi:hypothetical protein
MYRVRGMGDAVQLECPKVAPSEFNANGYQFKDSTGKCVPYDSGMGVDRLISVGGFSVRFKYLLMAGVGALALMAFSGGSPRRYGR